MQLNRRAFVGAGVVMGAIAGSAQAQTHASGGAAAQQRALAELARYVEQNRADWGLPGMTVCVVDGNGYTGFIRSGFARTEGRVPVGADHLFQIGSISKMMCALAAWQMVQEGKLALDARLSALMPEIPVADGGDITLQHLLNHTAGLPDDAPQFPPGGLWSGFAPGSSWSYSNTGYQIVGEIVARTDGRSYQEALAARVLQPLGMTSTKPGIRVGDRLHYAQGYEPPFNDRANIRPGPMMQAPWVDMDAASGCVAATAGDMAIFARYLVELAQGRGAPLLNDDAAARFVAVSAPGWADGAAYGNGIARITDHDRHYWHHTGGMASFSSSIHVDIEAGIACFASSNVGSLNYRPRDVTLHACQMFKAVRDGEAAPAANATRATVDHPDTYVGRYTAQSGESFELIAAGDQLRMRYNGRDLAVQQVEGGFACADERFAVWGLVVDVETDRAVRAWAGDVEFLRDPSKGYKPPAPAELRALAGSFDSDDRWLGPISVVARDGKLWLGNVVTLKAAADGVWRFEADDKSPERMRFDGVINGRPTRFWYSGKPFVRRFS